MRLESISVRKKYQRKNKYFFDLIVGCVRVNNCFVEWDDEISDFRLRLPTKKNGSKIYQVIWIEEDEVFDQIYQKVEDKFADFKKGR